MKYIYILLISCLSQYLIGQIIVFPDANLKKALVNHSPKIDLNNDGEIQEQEAKVFNKRLNVQSSSIENLSGLEYFINADELYAGFNRIRAYDFTNFSWLKQLDLQENLSLESINLQALTQLEYLNLNSCWRLEELDFSKNTSLLELNLFDMNSDIEILDVSKLDQLERVVLQNMKGLREVKWGSKKKLEQMDLSSTKIGQINLVDFPALVSMYGRYTLLAEIDGTANIKLQQVLCDNNPELSKVLLKNGNNDILLDIDFSECPILKSICIDDVVTAGKNQRWLKDDGTQYVDNCQTSTIEINENDIYVYPVPADEYVSVSGLGQRSKLDIYNVNGRLMKSISVDGNQETIDISNFERGYYILQVSIDERYKIYKRFIKLHY